MEVHDSAPMSLRTSCTAGSEAYFSGLNPSEKTDSDRWKEIVGMIHGQKRPRALRTLFVFRFHPLMKFDSPCISDRAVVSLAGSTFRQTIPSAALLALALALDSLLPGKSAKRLTSL